MVDDAALSLAGAGDQHLGDHVREGGRLALDRARERVAAEGAESDALHHRFLARLERDPVVVHHDQHAVAFHDRPGGREVERHHGDLLEVDVAPHVELGPVRQREGADALTGADPGVPEVPELGSLVLRIPAVVAVAEAENTFLGPALLLVPPRASDGAVVATGGEGLLEGLGLHDVGVDATPVDERAHALLDALLVRVDDEVESELLRRVVPELDHLPELPRRVDVEEREGQVARRERLPGEVEHDARILADRVHHHGSLEARGDLADDVDRLGLEGLQVRELVLDDRHGTWRLAGGAAQFATIGRDSFVVQAKGPR